MDKVLEVKNLVKSYGTFEAVKGVSFFVPRGKIIGLLGPNGAGKTTTMHMLLGITSSSGGEIFYFGKNFKRHRQQVLQRINFASSFNTLQGRISVWENLVVFANLYSVEHSEKKIMELSEYFEIRDLLDAKFWDLSSGQKTRVNLVKSMLNDPELILMDEPTASLDPDIADKTLTLIENFKKNNNLSILYTSHQMDEVTRICDEVIFLDQGKIVAQDSPLGLTRRIKNTQLQLTFGGGKADIEKFLKQQGHEFSFTHEFCVVIKAEEKQIPKLIFALSNLGIDITGIEIKKPSLEDVFLQIARKEEYVVD